MNPQNIKRTSDFIGTAYMEYGRQSLASRELQIKELLTQRSLPAEGWDDLTVKLFLSDVAAMDSNNAKDSVGVGEREGRVFSSVVRDRHFHLAHGIGRSGDINAIQPKAAGSSLILKLTHSLLKSALKTLGYGGGLQVLILPCATGMAMTLTMLTLRHRRPKARYVIMPRIDQKSCIKAIVTAQLEPLIVEPVLKGDQLETNMEAIAQLVESHSPQAILGVLCTTSCFAPRACDRVEEVAALCATHDIPHIINNAYGVQSPYYAQRIVKAQAAGRVDAVVSSTDKNFMVPVGGSFVYSTQEALINGISSNYPGRASIAPILDLFITLLQMGKNTLSRLVADQKKNFEILKTEVKKLCTEQEKETPCLRLLETPQNKISLAVAMGPQIYPENPSYLGSQLYTRRVSGLRVVAPGKPKSIAGREWLNFGSHSDENPNLPYFTVASAVGLKEAEIGVFVDRLKKTVKEAMKAKGKKAE